MVDTSSHKSPTSVRLITLNCWGLKYISRLRAVRLQAIADKLVEESDDYDVVALQEVWVQEDWEYFEEKCKDVFPYRRFFKSGILTGPGLAVLSKIPIEESFLYRFPINGRPSAIYRGDWMVGKSVAVTLLKSQSQQEHYTPIALLNSHMHAPYGEGDSNYSCHRACQAWDISKITRILRKAGYAVILVGDLNSIPGSLQYKLLTVEGQLEDSWNLCRDKRYSNEEIKKMNLQDQITIGGITCDSRLNSWRENSTEPCRLDYALIDKERARPLRAEVRFTERIREPYNCSYSDHYAYWVEIEVGPSEIPQKKSLIIAAERMAIYKELVSEIQGYLIFTTPFQTNWRKWHFIISLVLVAGIHVLSLISSFTFPFIGVLLTFASTMIGITGVTNGAIWYLFVRSELRALKEVQLEVEDAFRSLSNQN